MYKRGQLNSGWKRRYFILWKNEVLFYFKNEFKTVSSENFLKSECCGSINMAGTLSLKLRGLDNPSGIFIYFF